MALRNVPNLAGRRVVISGAARGIGAALAARLHERGARLALLGLEPELLEQVAEPLGAPWWTCDVSDRAAVDDAVDAAVTSLGGLDVVVANAGIAAQLPMAGGDPTIMERMVSVNVLGTYYTLRAAAPHVSHPGGYALAVASLAAAVQVPLLGAYSSSKAAVEAMGNTFRQELRPSGARVGVAYFSELDTDMTSRGFDTAAAKQLLKGKSITGVTPLGVGIDAVERGIARRARIIVAPAWVRPVLPIRMIAQHVVDVATRRGLGEVLDTARREQVELTTAQPEPRSTGGRSS